VPTEDAPMMNGRLRRGWVVEYCVGAVDVIPLVPPLNASRSRRAITITLS
jgi:hypothetical protein